jgi:eukaryotic-like serine/threonine-protein kinase
VAPPWQPAERPEPSSPVIDSDMLPGTRYRLRREIGRGASGVVFEAFHTELERRVAIKLLDAEHTHSHEFAARFRREARALSRVHHPGLVRVYDFGQTDDGRLFCAMELLEGDTVRRLVSQEPIDWMRALRIARQVCIALQVAHDNDLVHRDIKPENLFITSAGAVKLIDFGLAKSAEELGEAEDSATDLGSLTLFGTPEYIAPEQIAGGRVDRRADLYALGCVLYEMLSGRLPFVADSDVALLDAKLKGSPESLRERAPNLRVPRSVDRLVMRALARHPSRRFASAADMAEAIAVCLELPSRSRARRRAAGASVVAAVMAFATVLVGKQARPWLEALPEHLPWLAPAASEPSPAMHGPSGHSTAEPHDGRHDSDGESGAEHAELSTDR